MKVTYTPEQGDVRVWVFRPGRVRQSAAALVEKLYGKPWDQFVGEVQMGSIAARRVLLWHLMSLDHPAQRLQDVPDFFADEVTVSHETSELRSMLANAEQNIDKIPADQRDVAMSMLRDQLADAESIDEANGLLEGKASSNSAG